MLSQVHPHPLHLQIPKFASDYPSHIAPGDRQKASASPAYYPDISSMVSASLSPVRPDSRGDIPDKAHRLPSPASPHENSTDFELVGRSTGPFDSNVCHSDVYNGSSTPSYSSQPQPGSSVPGAPSCRFIINSASGLRDSATGVHYLSDSPSPVDVQPPPSLSHTSSTPPSQDRFPHSAHPPYSGPDRTISNPNPNSERSSAGEMDKYPHLQTPSSLLDQRRMSEPALHSGGAIYHGSSPDVASNARHQPSFQYDYSKSPPAMYLTPGLHRGASTGSLRDLRHQHYQCPPSNGGWKHDQSLDRQYEQVNSLEEPLSPFQPSFSGSLASPTGVPYSPINDNFYGPSPPGTGTSTSSGPLSAGLPGQHPNPFRSPQRSMSGPSPSHTSLDGSDRKNYSFIALPGNAVKKRPRRRYDEIERLYQCSWPDCSKAYGTLNHLNAHVTMQKHGPKRSPNEFKELRKQWRKAKKEAESNTSLESLRRASFSVSRDYDYDASRFAFSTSTHRPHLLDFPTSMQMQQSFNHGQYPDGVDEARHPNYPRGEHALLASSRTQYEDGLSSSWQGLPTLPSRDTPPSYASLPYPLTQQSHLPQHMVAELGLPNSVPFPPSPRRAINRLPPDSTLLTPLNAYHTRPLAPAMDQVGYTPYNFDPCDSDNSRPSTGHTSASATYTSDDDFHHRL